MADINVFDIEEDLELHEKLRVYHRDGILEEIRFKNDKERVILNDIIDNLERNMSALISAKKCIMLPYMAQVRVKPFEIYKKKMKDYIFDFRKFHTGKETADLYRELHRQSNLEQKVYNTHANRQMVFKLNRDKITKYVNKGDILGKKLFINFNKFLRPVENKDYEEPEFSIRKDVND